MCFLWEGGGEFLRSDTIPGNRASLTHAHRVEIGRKHSPCYLKMFCDRFSGLYGKRNYWQKGLCPFCPSIKIVEGVFVTWSWANSHNCNHELWQSSVLLLCGKKIWGRDIWRADSRLSEKIASFFADFFPPLLWDTALNAQYQAIFFAISRFSLKIVCFPFSLKKAGRSQFWGAF